MKISDTLYVSDLDGTLLGPDARLLPDTIEIINLLLSEGMLFTFATARSYVTARVVTQELKLTLPMITYTGVFLCDPVTGAPIEKYLPERARIERTLHDIEENHAPAIVYSLVDGAERLSWVDQTENAAMREYLGSRNNDKRLRPVIGYDELFAGEIFYITMMGELPMMRRVADRAEADGHLRAIFQRDTYGSRNWWLELFSAHAGKDAAAQKVRDISGARRLVSFGDNINDLSMFSVSDECYAVKNAHPDVKAAATGVIGGNDEDGVARWLEANIFR